jgi:hypothetical protein
MADVDHSPPNGEAPNEVWARGGNEKADMRELTRTDADV